MATPVLITLRQKYVYVLSEHIPDKQVLQLIIEKLCTYDITLHKCNDTRLVNR